MNPGFVTGRSRKWWIGCCIVCVTALACPARASWFSNAILNTHKTVDKAVKDTNREISRSKEKILESNRLIANPSPGPISSASPPALVDKQTALKEVDELGDKLKDERSEKVELKDEKKLRDGLIVALVSGIITLVSTGGFGRMDRRDKFLAAIEREWKLQTDGFDFARIPGYRRLLREESRQIGESSS